MLKVNNITMAFGGVKAIDEVSFEVKKGECVGLIGPNGAGKTTAFNMITGVYTPTDGEIWFTNEREYPLHEMKAQEISRIGISRTFQNIRLFKNMTVFDNVFVGSHQHLKSNLLEATFRTPGYVKEEGEIRKKTLYLLEKVGLLEEADDIASSLPYGKQRRLEIARALATEPKLLLLDEPAAGMNPNESMELVEFIREIWKEFDLTILLIEHHMDVVMNICERIYVLDHGAMIAEGTPEEIQNNPDVINAYLGV